MNNSNEQIINGANPSIIWTQYMDALSEYGKYMKSYYTKHMRTNKPITWSELDDINKKIHEKLDYLMTWDEKFNTNNFMQPTNMPSTTTNESFMRSGKIRLSESQLQNVIKEAVNRTLGSRIKTPSYMHLFHQYGGVRGAARLYLISKGNNTELEQALIEYGKDLCLDDISPKHIANYLIKNYPKVGM